MKSLLKKARENKKGFTLAELLVVVAIVGILVAISIPVFTAQLGKARRATNNANLRAAKAAAVSEYLTNDSYNNGGTAFFTYDIAAGSVTYEGTSVTSAYTDKGVSIGDSVSNKEVYDNIGVEIKGKTADSGDEVTGNEEVNLYAYKGTSTTPTSGSN